MISQCQNARCGAASRIAYPMQDARSVSVERLIFSFSAGPSFVIFDRVTGHSVDRDDATAARARARLPAPRCARGHHGFGKCVGYVAPPRFRIPLQRHPKAADAPAGHPVNLRRERIRINMRDIEKLLLENLTDSQKKAVRAGDRRLLVVAGAGSGKTEVMARRIAWWVGVEGVSKNQIVAFTFTERAAEEMKFRIRSWIEKITPAGEEVSLGQMYVGTIHGFCLLKIREFWPDDYHNYDILDESAKASLILRGFNGILGLRALAQAWGKRQFAVLEGFIQAYDQLHEHNRFEVQLPTGGPPHQLGPVEGEWCGKARLKTNTGAGPAAKAFGEAAARYYAYLRCRRFLDFSTSQTEFLRKLEEDAGIRKILEEERIHLVVDEVQDINPVQSDHTGQ
jgi:hypothetical protein